MAAGEGSPAVGDLHFQEESWAFILHEMQKLQKVWGKEVASSVFSNSSPDCGQWTERLQSGGKAETADNHLHTVYTRCQCN